LDIGYKQWPWLATLGWVIDQPTLPKSDPAWGFALTPTLARAVGGWQPDGQRRDIQPSPLIQFFNVWLLLSIAFTLCLWRGLAAGRLLPWQSWTANFRTGSPIMPVIVWGLLLVLYFFATWPPLIVLCWGVAVLLIAAQPHVGLWLAAAALPFTFQHKEVSLVDATWTIAPAHVLLLCLLPALVVRSNLGQPFACSHKARLCVRKIALQRWDWLALAWLALSLTASVNVWHWPAYWTGLFELVLMPLLLYAVVRVLVVTPQQWQRLVCALFLGGLLVAVIGLFDWLRGGGTAVDEVRRLVGPYFSANHTALYLVRTLLIGVGIALNASGNWRRWWLGACVLVTIALFLTASRGAWLLGIPAGGMMLGGTNLRWMRRGRLAASRQRWLWAVLLLIMLMIGALSLLFWERLTNLTSISQRWIIWQTTFRLWQDYWWWGVGPGGFFWRYPAYLTQSTVEPNLHHPHNLWLEFATGWGVAGLLWLGVFLFIGIRSFRQLICQKPDDQSWLKIGIAAALTAALAHAQVDAFTALPDLAAWHWLAVALWVQTNKNPSGLTDPKGFIGADQPLSTANQPSHPRPPRVFAARFVLESAWQAQGRSGV
ncbi:MAG: O-antigen ligase family protein, partial [Chloroflexota bacterium]|nr:O-antigen ligase family protein [Chloroflexota bacterium]